LKIWNYAKPKKSKSDKKGRTICYLVQTLVGRNIICCIDSADDVIRDDAGDNIPGVVLMDKMFTTAFLSSNFWGSPASAD
jgi:hypothetical protein